MSYSNIVQLLLRCIVAAIFIDSGRRDLIDPNARSKSIGMSKAFTVFLGIVEIAGGLGLIFGVLLQLAAIGLILIMLGAMQKKIAIWKTGFWGTQSTGWYYELLLVIILLSLVTTNGGSYVLMR